MEKYIFVDGRIRDVEKEYFNSCGYKIIKMEKCDKVYEEIASHTDIFINKINNHLIIEKNMYNLLLNSSKEFNEFLEENNYFKKYNIEIVDFNISSKYPKDIALNVAIINKCAIHNFKYTDKKLLSIINNLDYKKINVKQGYSKCSIAVISDNSCITSDNYIYKELSNNGIETLLVENVDKIRLLNKNEFSYMHGFIGGSIVSIQDKVIIFGDLDLIDNSNLIKKFILKQGKKIVSFENLPLIDYGGIVIV